MVKLSIITINFNNAFGLQKTIQSIIEQTFTDFEFILIDGGSTDSSLDVIKENHSIINYSISESDGGIYPAMNKGILKATGEYCLFLNSGDCLADNNILYDVFKQIDCEDIVFGNAIKIKPHYRRKIKYPPTLTLYDFFKTDAVIHHQASFIKRELFDKQGFYREDIEVIADWEFFFRTIILNEVKTKYIDRIICAFDGIGLSNTLTVNNPKRIKADQVKISILKSNFPAYILEDYKQLDKFLSHRTYWQKITKKISYFRIKRD
ncbi:MAG: glycosyltransferase family 2 protein [Paludibacter sp.]|nr:glycosyltransferase family 2 protein [Paludibacter sp.]